VNKYGVVYRNGELETVEADKMFINNNNYEFFVSDTATRLKPFKWIPCDAVQNIELIEEGD
jgi:hypothetical protein